MILQQHFLHCYFHTERTSHRTFDLSTKARGKCRMQHCCTRNVSFFELHSNRERSARVQQDERKTSRVLIGIFLFVFHSKLSHQFSLGFWRCSSEWILLGGIFHLLSCLLLGDSSRQLSQSLPPPLGSLKAPRLISSANSHHFSPSDCPDLD